MRSGSSYIVQTLGNSPGKPVRFVLGGSYSPGGQFWGFPKESSVCAESPAGAESLSARKNLPARKGFPARARLPALWQ